MGNKKLFEFYEVGKVLGHCEFCIHMSVRDDIDVSYPAFEYLYNSFIYSINRFWELLEREVKTKFPSKSKAIDLVNHVKNMREQGKPETDPLLAYVKTARNQLAHNDSIVWRSDEYEVEPDGIGRKMQFGPSFEGKKASLHSTCVAPIVNINFVGAEMAAIPVTDQRNPIPMPPPNTCGGKAFDNDLRNIMFESYDLYGKHFRAIVNACKDR